jgi:SpoVK/Ycf46/Vps4 family AAA+-type ATPase
VSGPDPDQAQQDLGGLAGLPGLETVTDQLAGAIAVVRAELAWRDAGVTVTRPAWKNLVFAGEPGSGKSLAAAAVGRIYGRWACCRRGI